MKSTIATVSIGSDAPEVHVHALPRSGVYVSLSFGAVSLHFESYGAAAAAQARALAQTLLNAADQVDAKVAAIAAELEQAS